jgi:hypothetical protein
LILYLLYTVNIIVFSNWFNVDRFLKEQFRFLEVSYSLGIIYLIYTGFHELTFIIIESLFSVLIYLYFFIFLNQLNSDILF